MSPQKDNMITKQEQELHTENKDNPWTLGSQMTISKIKSQSASTVTNTNIWQRNVRRKKRKT